MRRAVVPPDLTLAEIGEDALVRHIARWIRPRVGSPPSAVDMPVGPGDDAAVVRQLGRKIRPLALTTDMLVEGVHFLPDHPAADLGRKALAANLSDLAAMGARPAWFTVSLGAPGSCALLWVRDLYRGMAAAARPHACSCAGGDCVRSAPRVISIAAGGVLPEGAEALRRDAARPGMRLYVTGRLGDSSAGLYFLRHPRRRPRKPALQRDIDRLIARHRRPVAQVDAGLAIARLCRRAACMDLSDGLATDLPRMAEASRCAFEVDTTALPVSPALRRAARWARLDPLALALAGGEDYELLFATDAPEAGWREDLERIVTVRCIGWARAGKGVRWLGERGQAVAPPEGLFAHY